MTESLDGFDRKILRLIQQDCHMRAESIAEAVGLSASAVVRRLNRLRRSKVITAEVAVLDRKLAGGHMTFIANVDIASQPYDALARFRLWLEGQQDIQQAYYVTGSVDIILIILARDVEAYEGIVARILAQNPQIRRINTNMGLNVLKLGLALPMDAPT